MSNLDQEKTVLDFLTSRISDEELEKLKNLPSGIVVESMSKMDFSISPNPFDHDLYHGGCEINEKILLMYSSTNSNYLILVNQKTGERLKLSFSGSWATWKK